MRTLVFLHGVGDGEPESAWRAELNRALELLDRPALTPGEIKAPRYDDLLFTDGVAAKVPDVTYQVPDDTTARRNFERRQAELFRRFGAVEGVRGFGFGQLPQVVLVGAQQVSLKTPHALLRQVKRTSGARASAALSSGGS